ncbi:CPBP family intramembrane metalloprotease [Mariniflexile gromovii]|uniref:CPBP family intramembrane metalloprotease n=2 Tax=Mariniflexile gromovii TaxID=362523 RepID=A0ABS4BWW6_9FLAO|nr:CPBP family intramembrane metalloprotease [Mariniflexile gromovii]
MKTKTYKSIELFIIFIVLPVSFIFPYPPVIKLSIGFIGFLYVIYILLKVENQKFKIAPNLNWKRFWRNTLFKFIIIAILTTIFVWITDKPMLFELLINKPLLWVLLLFIYSVFSVYPQELLYRTFFFNRYKNYFKSESLFLFVNAICFSLSHLFFKNSLVLLMTFIGGLLFALTFNKTKSTLLVSIEHAIYGSWLFTVGMGAMLGFPT